MSNLWPSVANAFVSALSNEGTTNWMYNDNRGLVSTGIGNLIDNSLEKDSSDPAAPAVALAWYNADGSKTSEADIRAAWAIVKGHQDYNNLGGFDPKFRALTTIRLKPTYVLTLVDKVMNQFADRLTEQMPSFPALWADAQLAVMRWAWGNGPNQWKNGWPKFYNAVLTGDFATAAKQSEWANENAPVKADIAQMFANAAAQKAANGDPSQLVWAPPGGVPAPAPSPPLPTTPPASAPTLWASVRSAFSPKYASAASMDNLTRQIQGKIPTFEQFPADGQLAMLRWALVNSKSGPAGFGPDWSAWPRLTEALSQTPPDFVGASQQSTWENEAETDKSDIYAMFMNAHTVQGDGTDPSTLRWSGSSLVDEVIDVLKPSAVPTNPDTLAADSSTALKVLGVSFGFVLLYALLTKTEN